MPLETDARTGLGVNKDTETDAMSGHDFRDQQRRQRAGAFAVPLAVDFARTEVALEGGDDGFQWNVRVRRKAVAEAGEVLRHQFPDPTSLRSVDLPMLGR